MHKLYSITTSIISSIPPPTLKNIWLAICCLVVLQSLLVFNNTQITGNAITALIVWGGALICMEDTLVTFNPKPKLSSLILGTLILLYTLFRIARVEGSDFFLYLLVPLAGVGLVLLASSFKSLLDFKDSLIVLLLLPLYITVQIVFAKFVTSDLSALTAKFVLFWLSILGISPLKLVDETVFVNGGAVQVMHECNGFEMIMQMIITSIIFLIAFPLRSRLAKISILLSAPIIGFVVNSMRIALLALFTSFNSDFGRILFDFFHEQAGSLIFSGLSVFLLGYFYLALLDRELPPLHHD